MQKMKIDLRDGTWRRTKQGTTLKNGGLLEKSELWFKPAAKVAVILISWVGRDGDAAMNLAAWNAIGELLDSNPPKLAQAYVMIKAGYLKIIHTYKEVRRHCEIHGMNVLDSTEDLSQYFWFNPQLKTPDATIANPKHEELW